MPVSRRSPLLALGACALLLGLFLAAFGLLATAQRAIATTAPAAPPYFAPRQEITASAVHVVSPGDTLAVIARSYSVTLDALVAANSITDPNRIEVGQVLVLPGPAGDQPPAAPITPALPAPATPLTLTQPATVTGPLSDVIARMTSAARNAPVISPYFRTTWLTFYGRPGIGVMGILGAHEIPTMTKLLKGQAAAYNAANGMRVRVKPAYHLVYGMATVAPQDDNSFVEFLPDEVVMQYVEAGLEEKVAVILDIQMGALSVSEALSPALPFLQYHNVHLALDPEFAMSHPGQTVPGNPIGYFTGEQINEAQRVIGDYMAEHGIKGRRILLVHQFQDNMIINKDAIDWSHPNLDLTICADGFGEPWAKIWKYNSFFTGNADVAFTAFKLFYDYDAPLMTERQALGVDKVADDLFIDVTPNMIIYQ